MGIGEYGRHRGVSSAAVRDAVNQGKISDALVFKSKKKFIDSELADKLWVENTVVNNKNEGTLGGGQQKKGPSYADARAVKEAYAAKNEQLKYEKQSGLLCKVEDVERAAHNIATITRNLLMAIADKLSPILAAESDFNKINIILTKEIHQACENISLGNFEFVINKKKVNKKKAKKGTRKK